jgi:two-component system KDP operon response regulator KdpE
VEALDLGADDYITKPFGMNELTARVRALLRRGLVRHEEDSNEPFKCGDLEVDFDRRVVTRAGVEVKLTPHEYDILVYLSRNADRVITHRQLLSAVWGAPYSEETQLLRVHVGNLRRKIEANASIPQLITTEPGVGYRLRSSLV